MDTYICVLIMTFVIFNYTTELCRGDPCNNYTVVSDETRLTSFTLEPTDEPICDTFVPKWYRFNATSTGAMTTECPATDTQCGSKMQIWMNGTLPSEADENVTRKLCVMSSTDCCVLTLELEVKNCRSFFVYFLVSFPTQCMRYCVQDSSEGVVFRNNVTTDMRPTTETGRGVHYEINATEVKSSTTEKPLPVEESAKQSTVTFVAVGIGIFMAIILVGISILVYKYRTKRTQSRSRMHTNSLQLKLSSKDGHKQGGNSEYTDLQWESDGIKQGNENYLQVADQDRHPQSIYTEIADVADTLEPATLAQGYEIHIKGANSDEVPGKKNMKL